VLLGIAKKSKFAQGLNIEFETKKGYVCSTYIWLTPQYYHHDSKSSKIEFRGYDNDFSVLFKIESEPTFSHWLRITFSYSDRETDGRSNEIIGLHGNTYGKPHVSYSGHRFVSWMDYVDEGFKEHYSMESSHKPSLKERFNNIRNEAKELLWSTITLK